MPISLLQCLDLLDSISSVCEPLRQSPSCLMTFVKLTLSVLKSRSACVRAVHSGFATVAVLGRLCLRRHCVSVLERRPDRVPGRARHLPSDQRLPAAALRRCASGQRGPRPCALCPSGTARRDPLTCPGVHWHTACCRFISACAYRCFQAVMYDGLLTLFSHGATTVTQDQLLGIRRSLKIRLHCSFRQSAEVAFETS